jgi:hypothetical protein
VGHPPVELALADRVLGTRRDRAAAAGLGPPQPLDVLLGEDHRGVEADDREVPRDVEDRPDDLLADARVEEVELRGVVPREARAVVAVIDVAGAPGRPVDPLEDDRGVAVVPVVVLEDDADAVVVREVGAGEGVHRVRWLVQREEPLGVLDHPSRIDPHVVRDHVARETDPARPASIAEVRVGLVATEVRRDPVVVERIRGRDRVGIAAHALDPLRCVRSLPQPDQP